MTSAALAVPAPPPGPEALAPLRDLPGLAHACVLHEDGGRVLAEIGTDEGTAAAVLAWGRRASGVAADRGLALEDVIVTSDVAHHLLRAVGGAGSRAWVYLRVDRERGNLALARRRLAAVTSPSGPSIPSDAPRSTPRPLSAPTPPPATTPAPPVRAMAGTFPRRVPAPTAPSAPAAAIAAPPTAAPTAGPAPSPAALPPAPVLPEPRRPPGSAPTTRPAGPVPPADVEHRRSPPQDSAGVLSQRWRTDPETLRRVLSGLLRLGRGTPPAGPAASTPTTTRSPGATPTRRNP